MNFKNDNKRVLFTVLFCLFSFVGGAVNGFLGTGGGIVFVIMLSSLTKNKSKDSFATTLLAIIVISLFGIFSYKDASMIDFKLLLKIATFGAIGGLLGAFLVEKINAKILNTIFAILIIYSGISMLLR